MVAQPIAAAGSGSPSQGPRLRTSSSRAKGSWPSARGWVPALVAYEVLTLRELGYGAPASLPDPADLPANLALLDRLGPRLARYALAPRHSDVMAARAILRDRLDRIG